MLLLLGNDASNADNGDDGYGDDASSNDNDDDGDDASNDEQEMNNHQR